MRPFSISEQATFLFFLFYFNATFSLGVFRTSFGLLEAPVSEKTVTVSQVMHRWIGPADLDGFLGCNDMQRPSDPGPVVFSQVALKSPPFFFFAMRNCVFTQHVPALVQRGLGNGGGVAKVRSVTECLCTSTSTWQSVNTLTTKCCEGWCCHPNFQWSVNLWDMLR